jgi:hypothetical protein
MRVALHLGFPLSRIPTGKNKNHHPSTEIGHDGDNHFHGEKLWEPSIEN